MWIYDNDTSATTILYQSTIVLLDAETRYTGIAVCGLALLVSVIQTIWSFTSLDYILRWLFNVYTNDEFVVTSVSVIDHIPSTIRCHQFNRRFSHIPCPHRLILVLLSMKYCILQNLMTSTFVTKEYYEIHGCADYNTYPQPRLTLHCYTDPCAMANNSSISTDYQWCSRYESGTSEVVAVVTSFIAWFNAIHFIFKKLITIILWILFRVNDQPRLLYLCANISVKIVMILAYASYWLTYAAAIILLTLTDKNVLREQNSTIWYEIFPTMSMILFAIPLGTTAELLHNWLRASSTINNSMPLSQETVTIVLKESASAHGGMNIIPSNKMVTSPSTTCLEHLITPVDPTRTGHIGLEAEASIEISETKF